jgi:hypothetical protein
MDPNLARQLPTKERGNMSDFATQEIYREALGDLFAKKSRDTARLAQRKLFDNALEAHCIAGEVLEVWKSHTY